MVLPGRDSHGRAEGTTRGRAHATSVAVLLCAALALVLAAPPLPGPIDATEAQAAPKKKTKRCKQKTVRVRTGKRVACLPAKRVLPKPKAGDPRLLLTRSAFGRDWSQTRNRRGKRAQSLPKLIRKLGPRAPALLARATSRGLARLDGLSASAAADRAGARAVPAATGCTDVPKGAKEKSSFTSNDGGTRVRATATLGSEGAGLALELSGNGLTVKADLDFGACEPNEVEAPACPTAAGQLRGKIRYKLLVSISVSRGDDEVWSQSSGVTRTTKLEGWTDTDAKLDYLDVTDEEVSTATLGGSSRAFAPISIRTRINRETRVDMRSGAYEPAHSDVTVSVDMAGLHGSDRAEVQDDLEQRARADADRQFRAIVEKAISGYRNREERWQQPNTCATLEHSPAPGSITVRRSQAGSFRTTAVAKQDGQESELDARLSAQVNGTFSPTRSGGQRATFGYTVGGSASGTLSASVRATSKAGVAERPWSQPIEVPPPPLPAAFNGTFNASAVYDADELGTGNSISASWTNGNFHARSIGPTSPGGNDAQYTLRSGSAQYHYTGHVGDCDVVGNGTIDLGGSRTCRAWRSSGRSTARRAPTSSCCPRRCSRR